MQPIHSQSLTATLFLLLHGATAFKLSIRNATQQWDFSQIPSSRNLTWYPCLSKYSCAMLDVPLDYSKPNGTRATVPLIKISAQDNSPNGTYQGMLLTNPGGPGEMGVNYILTTGYSQLVPTVGSNYDIVSFDPRGMGRSIPLANCSASGSSKLRHRASGLSGPELPLAYWDSTFASAAALGQACEGAIGGLTDAGPHMSTPVVATDMLSIVDAFATTDAGKSVQNASLLNYWGISYGTFLGETFASLYPDRVGRFVIDGVVDPEDYSSGTHHSDIFETDPAIISFFEYCFLAGLQLCPFYTGNSAKDIHTRFDSIFAPLNASFAISQKWTNASLITQTLAQIKITVRIAAYNPISGFPALAQQLVGFESALKNLTASGIAAASQLGLTITEVPGTMKGLQEWTPAVVCSDSPSVYNNTYADLEPSIDILENQSFIAGEVWGSLKVLCTGWSIRAAWRYPGLFGADTKNPILFVSNTIDLATPLANSQKWSPRYKNSRVLITEGVGHTSLATNNACANSKIGRYFQTGELPAPGTVCKVEAGAFGVVLQSLSTANTTKPITNMVSSAGNSEGSRLGLALVAFLILCFIGN